MREAGGQDAGFPGAGTGQHQQRTIDGFDGRALFGVQAGQVVLGEVGWVRHGLGYNAVPGRLETCVWGLRVCPVRGRFYPSPPGPLNNNGLSRRGSARFGDRKPAARTGAGLFRHSGAWL